MNLEHLNQGNLKILGIFSLLILFFLSSVGVQGQSTERYPKTPINSWSQKTSRYLVSDPISFSIPVVLPLEVGLGRYSWIATREYTFLESNINKTSDITNKGSYIGAESAYLTFKSDWYRLEFRESFNLLTAPVKEQVLHMNDDKQKYAVDSGVTLSYFLSHASLYLGLGHSWRQNRVENDPDETLKASLHLGYGFGRTPVTLGQWPINITLGISSRYNLIARGIEESLDGADHRTIFFTPGLNFYSNSLNLWANFELPIYTTQLGEDIYRDRIRGTIGMKYYIK